MLRLLLLAHLLAAPPVDSARLELRVNLPAYRLDVLGEAGVIESFGVAIGMPSHRTPRGDFALRRIIWNPRWYPPPSPWAKNRKPALPGPNNPVGRTKMPLVDLYYLHGTAERSSIRRAVSHGCIRLTNENVLRLARYVAAAGDAGLSADAIDSIEARPRRTREVSLRLPVPVRVAYETVELHGDSIYVYPDVYWLAPASPAEMVYRALERAGIPRARVHPAIVRDLSTRGRKGAVAMPMDRVLIAPVPLDES